MNEEDGMWVLGVAGRAWGGEERGGGVLFGIGLVTISLSKLSTWVMYDKLQLGGFVRRVIFYKICILAILAYLGPKMGFRVPNTFRILTKLFSLVVQ